MKLLQDIQQIRSEFLEKINAVTSSDGVEKLRIEFLGRKGSVATIVAAFKLLPESERRTLGPVIQELRSFLESTLDEKKGMLEQKKTVDQAFFDVTTSRFSELKGRKHVYSQVIEQLEDIFLSMGYDIVQGNEVETDYYNFTALNIPENHPAREMTDTFWLANPGLLLRTHTSAIQARIMKERKPPLAIFSTGRCYRNEQTDATHDFMFMQAECMFIDTDVSVANLLATAQTFLRAIFDKHDLNIRVRPGFFPFVEPGLEIDSTCPFCKHGCSICKKTGWIEMLGSGLIHPNVLKMGGIDESKYSGFAFGMGIERLIMLRYGITDIRLFRSNKLSFLDQF